jgi:hypothetical protein
MHYFDYTKLFDVFVNKYIVPSIHVSLITSIKNQLGNAQCVKIG